jgi:hypothetical protein
LENSDGLVQRTALRALCHLSEVDSLPYLKAAITSSDAFVRLAAVEELAQIQPRSDEVTRLLRIARKDPSQEVNTVANRALWPFHRQNQSVRDRLDYDHEVQIFQKIPLPKHGWKFCLDPQQEGHLKKWYVRDFDDSHWKEIGIESAWQEFGYDYIGVAWYRCWISLPSRPEHLAVDLQFDGVDENAWVWVNGIYIGSHAIGPTGWDQPFYLDVTEEIRWGMKNQITVRVMNTTHAGGIWRPVRLEVLR